MASCIEMYVALNYEPRITDMPKVRDIMAVDRLRAEPVGLEPYVDSTVAGDFLLLHPVTVTRLAREGHIPGHPVRRAKRKQWRFLLSELSTWLAEQTGTE